MKAPDMKKEGSAAKQGPAAKQGVSRDKNTAINKAIQRTGAPVVDEEELIKALLLSRNREGRQEKTIDRIDARLADLGYKEA